MLRGAPAGAFFIGPRGLGRVAFPVPDQAVVRPRKLPLQTAMTNVKLRRNLVVAAFMLGLAACAADPVRIIEPVSTQVRGASHVADVRVTVGELARAQVARFDERASEARTRAEPAIRRAERPSQDEYATLPFARMLALVVADAARAQGLNSGRPLRLDIYVNAVRTADPAMAIVVASRDQLAGTVRVADAQSGEPLGAFHVDVINVHSGLVGLALRGGGIRERLAEEFAVHVARQLGAPSSRRD